MPLETEALALRPEVAAFAQMMERVLRAGESNGCHLNWRHCHPGDLLKHAQEDLHELVVASAYTLAGGNGAENVLRVAASGALHVMMLADVVNDISAKSEVPR